MNTRRPLLGVMGMATLGAGVSATLTLLGGPPPLALATTSGLALATALTLASARPDLQVFGPALCRATHPGRLALTFDDGPDPTSTPRLLDTLAAHGATATFFVLADRVGRHPELLRAMVAGGHEIGLHGLHHDPWLTVLPPARGAARLREARDQLHEHGAPPVRWFRPPFGAVSPRVYAAAARVGLEVAWCSIRTGDGGLAPPERIRARCRDAVGTDIVLLHEGPRHARTLLGELLDEWAGRGIAATSLRHALEPPPDPRRTS